MNVKNSKMAGLLSLCISLGMISPAFAAGDDNLDKVVEGATVVTRVGGAATGAVVGTPIAAVRETVKSYIDMTSAGADKIGGKDCAPCCLVVSVVTIPASLVVGGVKGLYYGCKNGLVKGFDTPFHPDSYSLAKDLEE